MPNQILIDKLEQLKALAGPAELVAIELCLDERIRQITVEGRSTSYDDNHRTGGELAAAAACYADHVQQSNLTFKATQTWKERPSRPLTCWPFNIVNWKPTGVRRSCEKAAALILAELAREVRAGIL